MEEDSFESALNAYNDFNIPITHKEGSTSYPMLVSTAMIDDAVRMRTESKSYKQIAEVMQVTAGIAHALVREGLRTSLQETTEERRKLEVEKYDSLERDVLEIFWRNKEGNSTQQLRALHAVDRLVAISERRAKLLGLDSPTVVEARPLQMNINGVDLEAL